MPTDTDTETDEVRGRAVDAAMAVFERSLKLMAPHRHLVEEAIEAAGGVYDDAQQAEVDRMMDQTGFISMEATDKGMQLRLKMARDIAAAMCSAFDALIHVHGATNYVKWEGTVTDPATEEAIKAGAEDVPPLRKYHFIVVKPGGKSPHTLRREVEAERDQLRVERDWLLAEADDDTRARYARASSADGGEGARR